MKAAGFIPCMVEEHFGAWLVTFDDGLTLLLQSDCDQAAFAVNCAAITAPDSWGSTPSTLGDDWLYLEPGDIGHCPDEYWELAEV